MSYISIYDNYAEVNGGGLRLDYSNPIISHVSLFNNAAINGGGAIRLKNSNPILINMTIVDNYAYYGSEIHCEFSEPKIINSIITNIELDNIIHWFPSYFRPSIFNSNIQNGFEGMGNINSDPMFVDRENKNYNLLPSSLCIDSGLPYLEINGDVILEYDESDYIGTAPDMGAYEYNPLSIDKPIVQSPTKYPLKHSYPNPFNPITNISYNLSKDTKVVLEIYNINGELITTLFNGIKTAGNHSIEWNAKFFQSGIYFVKFSANEIIQVQKLMLLK
jgi:hypothetical protein